ncbi:uncharacterized protein LOC124722615 [Schistocerca piceifrons]|uniref:uncharacterized protein LOC124722615 n=1 Tax=Schistocerca piceifrons TaxID=274613 RepID=UPI001F5F65F9|nr:uncharacterized protein LOC124722615 [Schistocerca piceifrons]
MNHDVPAEHSRAVPDVQHSKTGLDTKNHLHVVEQPHSMLWQSGIHHGASGLDMDQFVAVQHGYAIPIVQHSTTGLDTRNQVHVEQPHTMPWQPGVHHGASCACKVNPMEITLFDYNEILNLYMYNGTVVSQKNYVILKGKCRSCLTPKWLFQTNR